MIPNSDAYPEQILAAAKDRIAALERAEARRSQRRSRFRRAMRRFTALGGRGRRR